jgi:hypothetical protein
VKAQSLQKGGEGRNGRPFLVEGPQQDPKSRLEELAEHPKPVDLHGLCVCV